jgi:hypothetical protein
MRIYTFHLPTPRMMQLLDIEGASLPNSTHPPGRANLNHADPQTKIRDVKFAVRPCSLSLSRRRKGRQEAASTSLHLYVDRPRSASVLRTPLGLFLGRSSGLRRKLKYRRLLTFT